MKILQKIAFEADPNSKTLHLNTKSYFFDFEINQISLYSAMKILQKIASEADPNGKDKTSISKHIKTIFPF